MQSLGNDFVNLDSDFGNRYSGRFFYCVFNSLCYAVSDSINIDSLYNRDMKVDGDGVYGSANLNALIYNIGFCQKH